MSLSTIKNILKQKQNFMAMKLQIFIAQKFLR